MPTVSSHQHGFADSLDTPKPTKAEKPSEPPLPWNRPEFKDECMEMACGCLCCWIIIAIFVVFIVGLIPGEGNGGSTRGVGFLRTGGGGSRGGGRGGGSSCFPGGELVEMDGGASIAIADLLPGATIAQGGRVNAVMKLQSSEPMYHYNGSVFVTGSHMVYENEERVAVQDSPFAVQTNDSPEFVYNLFTETYKVVFNGTVFADWQEWDDGLPYDTWETERLLLQRLNDDSPSTAKYDPEHIITEGGFAAGTPIVLEDEVVVSIERVEPGAVLADGSSVIATMKVFVPVDTPVYRYRDATVTEWTLVVDEDGVWRHVQCVAKAELVAASTGGDVWYQLWTTSHDVTVNGTTFADYFVFEDQVD